MNLGDSEELPNPISSLSPVGPPPLLPIPIVRDGILTFVGCLVVTFVLVIIAIIAGIVTGAITTEQGADFMPSAGWVVGFLFFGELPFLASGIYLRRKYRNKGHVLEKLFGDGKTLLSILIGIGAGIGMAAIGTLHAMLAMKLFGRASTEVMDRVMQTLFFQKGRPDLVVEIVFTIAIMAPLCEEYFFRGALFSSVRSTRKAWAGAIVSSTLFAIAHFNPTMITYYLIFGLTMCWLLSKTKTMAAPIAAHMTVNTVACIAILLSPPGGK